MGSVEINLCALHGTQSSIKKTLGFSTMLILLVTHGVPHIPLLQSQGTGIILFFIWITSSQAILELTRLRAVASWKVSVAVLVTLLFIVFTYLFAVESLAAFFHPNPEEATSYFKVADLPDWLFALLLLGATGLTVLGWYCLYLRAHGQRAWIPPWVEGLRSRLYPLFMNRLYADEIHRWIGLKGEQLIHRVDKLKRGWSR